MQLTADIDLTTKDIAGLASLDAAAGFLARLGYPTDRREDLSAAALGLPSETADAIRKMELLAEDDERFFRVIFVQLRSVTAKARNELARNLGGRSADHLLILTKDFDVLEFVLIDKETRQRHAPGGGPSVRVIPRVVTVMRKASTHLDRRILRRMTWTGKDGLDQFDKLRSIFEAAHYSEQYFQNRALFADHFLETRLREDPAWRDDPSTAFAAVRDLLSNARSRWANKPEQTVRGELFEPLWKLLGFKAKVAKAANKDHLTPDYELHSADGQPLTVAFCYRWDRWLDGPDLNDPDTPEENPGAAVVSALAEGKARWIIVTNGKFWRLYSRDAHSRSTNFYEVDLEEALLASGETDPNEAFRYWWLFFRRQAFETLPESDPPACWLDTIVRGSRDYAKRLGDRLKDRIFVEIFPHLAQGFLLDRKKRLGLTRAPSDDELRDTFEATLSLLYRLLFLLYAESRDLLPVREAAYKAASLKQVKEEIAEHAGVADSEAASKLKAYSDAEATIYDRLTRLFAVMDQGDAVLNVPCYNGGLFLTQPDQQSTEREHRIARFLLEHKVPDRHLALAIDRLARDVDDKTFSLSFIDYKSLEVRHLGSIYEGLLEFKLKIAEEDLGVTTEKKAEKYIPLAQVRPSRGKGAGAVVRKGEVYLSNDKAERKATGSYYTPDPIVEYIVEHTVGPVLAEKLDGLRSDLNAAGKTYHRHLTNAKNNPGLVPKDADPRAFAAAKTYAEHRDLVDRVFDLKVLDPAMGSGHFLVEAVDFITDRLLDFLNRFPHNPVQFALDKTRRSILDALGEQGVTVDPEKLTDVNLLKRHVLKRCIYGVDLNPMAVELAKVSLWLDAFTLGAPLSFLDHHLRCGNSLIGATFEDLKKATTGQLFAIDYEPLLRAIRHVLFVNEMADATAAEVHRSADEYSHARRELSGYQIVLDLLVADHFVGGAGVPPAKQLKPSSLLKEASDLDLTTRAKLLASLDEKAALLVEQVEHVARRSDLRFFHWEIEFPEVFFGFADADRRQIKHRNDIAAGAAGFDAVVGNPPYLRQESLRVIKSYLSTGYASYSATADLFVYFYDRACLVARDRGFVGFITSGSWMRANFGEPLRRELSERMGVHSVIDFGEWQPFPGAEMIRPSIVVLQRGAVVDGSGVFRFLTVGEPPNDLSEAVRSGPRLGSDAFTSEPWRLDSDDLTGLFEKLNQSGQRLGTYVQGRILRGIITGLTDAFIVNGEALEAVQRHSSAREVLFPYAEGKDARSWYIETAGRYVIAFPKGWSRLHGAPPEASAAERWLESRFPSVYEWLLPFRARAVERGDRGEYWWELRSCDYWSEFSVPKIVWPDIGKLPRFSLDIAGHVLGNTAYFIPTSDYFLLGVLSSWTMWFAISRACQPLRLRGGRWQYRLFSQFMERLPIPTSAKAADEIAGIAQSCSTLGPQLRQLERKAEAQLAATFLGSAELPSRAQAWWELESEDVVQLIRGRKEKPIAAVSIERANELLATLRQRRAAVLRQITDAEAELNARVDRAFGLSRSERELIARAVAS